MTLIEVMVIMTVLSLIALGTTVLMKTSVEIQKKSDLTQRLLQTRANLIQTLENDDAWARTVSNYPFGDSTGLGCLRDGSSTPCTHDATPRVNQNFNVRTDGDGSGVNSLFYEGEVPETGIAPNGEFCTNFDATVGNDLCPYRYNFDLQFTCPTGQATCSKPKVQVFGRFIVNPETKSGVLARINIGEMDFEVQKSEQTRFEPLIIRHFSTTNAGGGACQAGNTRPRDLTEVLTDSGGNVLNFNSSNNRFRLKKGEYTCDITVQVFDLPAGFSIRLEQATGGPNPIRIPVATGYTPEYASVQVSGSIRLNLTDDSPWLHLVQYCAESNSTFDMGIPTPSYTQGTSFTTISCVRRS